MSEKNDGGQVFPGPMCEGISMRDYFAAAVITGLMARSDLPAHKEEVVTAAYVYADAMLAERSK